MDKRIQKALILIEKKFRDKILLQDLADAVDLSAFHFQKLFKKETGESPAACIARIRLDRAAHLIRVNENLSLTKIALDCGFNSPSSFSRAFAQKFGTSPSQFKQQRLDHQKNGNFTGVFPAEVVFFPETIVFYSQTSIYDPNFLEAFESTEAFCALEDVASTKETRLGIYAQMPFHAPRKQLNYYAGIQIDKATEHLPEDRIYKIPAGRYVRFYTDTSYEDLLSLLVRFQNGWLNKMPYHITELFAFESILQENKPSDYPQIRRYIYLPVKKK